MACLSRSGFALWPRGIRTYPLQRELPLNLRAALELAVPTLQVPFCVPVAPNTPRVTARIQNALAVMCPWSTQWSTSTVVHSNRKPFRELKKGGTGDPAASREASQASCVQRVVRQPAVSLSTLHANAWRLLDARHNQHVRSAELHRVKWHNSLQKTDGGWRSQPGMRWAGRKWSRWRRRKVDGLVRWVDELECDGLGVDQSQARHESHVSPSCANARFFVGPSVVDAVSLIRTSPQKNYKALSPRTWHITPRQPSASNCTGSVTPRPLQFRSGVCPVMRTFMLHAQISQIASSLSWIMFDILITVKRRTLLHRGANTQQGIPSQRVQADMM